MARIRMTHFLTIISACLRSGGVVALAIGGLA
jgi:hypothetical protein